MTFLSPWRLVFLAAPVLLVLAYLVVQRMRARFVLRFTDVDLLASVAPRRAGWRRHVPAIALLLALVALVLAFAQPARAVRVPKDRATIMLALDVSASMSATDVKPSRLVAAQQQARRFVSEIPPRLQVGLVSFDRTARVLVSPTTDRASVLSAIDSLQTGPSTATGAAILASLQAVQAVPPDAQGRRAPAAIVLMSDGTPTVADDGWASPQQAAEDAAARSKAAGVPVDTIAYGTFDGQVLIQGVPIPVPVDPEAMARVASAGGGQSFRASSTVELRDVYSRIGKAIGYQTERREVTAYVTGIALGLAIASAAFGLLWTQRLV